MSYVHFEDRIKTLDNESVGKETRKEKNRAARLALCALCNGIITEKFITEDEPKEELKTLLHKYVDNNMTDKMLSRANSAVGFSFFMATAIVAVAAYNSVRNADYGISELVKRAMNKEPKS